MGERHRDRDPARGHHVHPVSLALREPSRAGGWRPACATGSPNRTTTSPACPGASNAFASALWALDYLHWWAAHGAAGVNFHNKQWLYTDTIVPDPAAAGRATRSPRRGTASKRSPWARPGRSSPLTIGNADGINLTAYCIG